MNQVSIVKPPHCQMQIQAYHLDLHLGWSEAERAQTQKVKLDIQLDFKVPPQALNSDDLQDTLCYHSLLKTIEEKLQGRTCRLLEHLAQHIFDIIQTFVQNSPCEAKALKLSVTKLQPPVPKLQSVGFCLWHSW